MAGVKIPPGLALVARFVVAGLLNTAVGLGITLALDIGLGLKPALANAAGYAVGIVVSWTLQRRFVFRTGETGWDTRAKYLATIALSFGVNQGVLWAMPMLVGDEPLARTFSQLVAMGTYTVTQFVLFRLWVFRKVEEPSAAA